MMLSLLITLLTLRCVDAKSEDAFAQRGYYITFMRMPTYDLADWK